jgi:hypothetical protein
VTPRRLKSLAAIEGEEEVRRALRMDSRMHGVRGLARNLDVTASHLSRVLRGEARVTAQLAKAVGYEKVIVFREVKYENASNA